MLFTMELSESLREFVEEGQDWERKNTSVKGVSIVRMPPYKNRPASLAIEINPVKEDGSPMKKKGVYIMSIAELHAFRTAFNNQKIDTLIAALEEVLPERKSSGKQAKSDVLQI